MPFRPSRIFSLVAVVAACVASGCSSESHATTSTSVPNTATHLALVSGTGQAGAVASALTAPLVVEALDGDNRPVAGVPVSWAISGGGSVSAATGTTDAAGLDSVTWTLGATPGVQVATVTSSTVSGASVAFTASNGATIVGDVTSTVSPQGMLTVAASRTSVPRTSGIALSVTKRAARMRKSTSDRIVVGFRNDVLHVDAAGASTYRSMTAARATASVLGSRAAALMQQQPLAEAEISPAMLAVRFRVVDSTQMVSVLAALANDPSVAWVTRDNTISAWTLTTKHAPPALAPRVGAKGYAPASVATKLPSSQLLYAQYWSHNMVDLPRAWALSTGSASVTVAVVDMGIRPTNPDITANLTTDGYDFVSNVPVTEYGYTSPQQICLPDGSGTIIGSFTTFSEDSGPHADPTDPDDLSPDPDFNCWDRSESGDHGLWTAGIIGATGTATGTNVGFVGVNWNVRIRAIRVLDVSGSGNTFDIAQGILYAAGLPAYSAGCVVGDGGCNDSPAGASLVQTSRAPIINMSFGGGDDPVMESAITAAANAGCLLVASAGNNSSDFADVPVYPAGYSNVMAVSAVGPSGNIASYSDDGLNIAVAAPGGDFQLDDNSNGGGGVLGPGWDFVHGVPAIFDADGTSAAAPYVSGVAALLLAQNPSLSASALQTIIQQYATRAANASRNDTYGWGIVDAYNALTQTAGPKRQTYVRLLDANSGALIVQAAATASGSFALTQLPPGSYVLQAGEDENGDATIGIPGRRFGWAGGVASPTVFSVGAANSASQTAAVAIGLPVGSEPNAALATANAISVGGYVAGLLTTPNTQDVYKFNVSSSGQYTLETSGLIGSCGLGIEMGTFLTLESSTGATIATDNAELSASITGPFCSKISMNLTPGTYYAIVSGSSSDGATYGVAVHGQYRLQVRAGP
jgi:Subtilase family